MNACPKRPIAIKSARHVSFLHQLVCVICGNPEVQVHHLLRCRTRRGQYKAGDNQTVPLCACHHNVGKQSLHLCGLDEPEYFAFYGIKDPEGLSDDLFAHTGDYEACMAIIAGCKSSVSETAPLKESAAGASDASPSDATRLSASLPNPSNP